MTLNPKCCTASKANGTVRLFVPETGGAVAWVVPIRTDDETPVDTNASTVALFCPFCGTKLKLEHVPFDEALKPYGA